MLLRLKDSEARHCAAKRAVPRVHCTVPSITIFAAAAAGAAAAAAFRVKNPPRATVDENAVRFERVR